MAGAFEVQQILQTLKQGEGEVFSTSALQLRAVEVWLVGCVLLLALHSVFQSGWKKLDRVLSPGLRYWDQGAWVPVAMLMNYVIGKILWG